MEEKHVNMRLDEMDSVFTRKCLNEMKEKGKKALEEFPSFVLFFADDKGVGMHSTVKSMHIPKMLNGILTFTDGLIDSARDDKNSGILCEVVKVLMARMKKKEDESGKCT